MHIPTELLPVLQITLPLVIAVLGASWIQNKRLDDIIRRLEVIEGVARDHTGRLASIETLLRTFGERLARLEERTPPLVHH